MLFPVADWLFRYSGKTLTYISYGMVPASLTHTAKVSLIVCHISLTRQQLPACCLWRDVAASLDRSPRPPSLAMHCCVVCCRDVVWHCRRPRQCSAFC